MLGRKGYEQQAVLASMVEGVLAVDLQECVISLNRAARADRQPEPDGRVAVCRRFSATPICGGSRTEP